MFVVVVSIQVKPERVNDFRESILENARNTRLEPGNVRFDVLQDTADPTKWVLYEAYNSQDDHKAHQTTAHYLKWRDLATDWMAAPRTRTTNNAVFFGEGVL